MNLSKHIMNVYNIYIVPALNGSRCVVIFTNFSSLENIRTGVVVDFICLNQLFQFKTQLEIEHSIHIDVIIKLEFR